jgi:hypothetical protein
MSRITRVWWFAAQGWSGMRYGIQVEVWPALLAATMASYKGQMKVANRTQE